MRLSEHFDLKEFTKSDYAIRNNIDNTPSEYVVQNLQTLCTKVLEPIRHLMGKPIKITSGYRCTALNRAIGGSESSQHCSGHACDFEIIGQDNEELAVWVSNNCDFDQLILEFYNHADPNSGWVHVSYVAPQKNRRSVLTIYKDEEGKTRYKEGIE